MLFRIIWAVVVGTAFLIAIIAERRKDKKHQDKMQQFLMATIRQKPFSVTEYLDRIERESLKLAEHKEQYTIVLWWGFDGLRLNEDGTSEWMSRNPNPQRTKQCFPQMQNAPAIPGTEICCSMESAMQAQTQALQAMQMQTLQAIQYETIINSIRPAHQIYPAQCCVIPYAPSYGLTQNCCTGQRTFT